MLKRGQVTVFVMIGLIILLTVGYFFYASSSKYEIASDFKEFDKLKIKNAVQQCFDSSLDTGLRIMQFGYVNFSEYRSLPLFYSEGLVNFPSLESFSADLGSFVDNQMMFCLENDKQDLEIDRYHLAFKNPKTRVIFSENEIDVSMSLEVTSNMSNGQIKLDSFRTEKPIRFKKIWDTASSILEETKKDPAVIPIDFLLEQEQEITFTDMNESNLVYYTLIDLESEFNDEHYSYSFAVQLAEEEE